MIDNFYLWLIYEHLVHALLGSKENVYINNVKVLDVNVKGQVIVVSMENTTEMIIAFTEVVESK